MSKFEELQAAHRELLERYSNKREGRDALLKDAQAYIERVRLEAEQVPEPLDRNQLRANLRFWGSFVYDQTGTYPDTLMRPWLEAPTAPPAEAPPVPPPPPPITPPTVEQPTSPEAPARRAISIPMLAVLGACLLLALAGVFSLSLLRSRPQAGLPPTSTAIEPAATEQPGGVEPSSEDTEEPAGGEPTPSPATPATSEVSNVPTQSVQASPSPSAGGQVSPPTPTFSVDAFPLQTATAVVALPTATMPLPTTGGGGGELLFFASVAAQSTPPDCSARSLHLEFDPSGVYTTYPIAPAQVTVSQAGSGELLGTAELAPGQNIAQVELPNPGETDMLLVQARHAQLSFEAVILTFPADCSRNQVTMQYLPEIEDADTIEILLNALEPVEAAPLSLRWRLETWGPSPFDYQWVAEFTLDGEGGDGNFLYWATGDIAGSGSNLLPGDRLLVQQFGCDPARVELGVSSAGETSQRTLLLASPLCPDWVPIAQGLSRGDQFN